MAFLAEELTHDRFLDGRLQIWQPRKGYRAGVDPVLLAASVPARAGQTVLELGCGAGVASLCLARRIPNLQLTGIEIQPDYAALARRNAKENDLAFTVYTADLCSLPSDVRQQRYDLVIANPPYFLGARRTAAKDQGRESALAGETPLGAWIEAASRRLAPLGWLTIIQDAARLPDLLRACDASLGSLRVMPLVSRKGRPANLIVLRARKGGRAAFRMYSPIIMHMGDAHEDDCETYSGLLRNVLRHGAALWPEVD